jgi:HSP20 family protein
MNVESLHRTINQKKVKKKMSDPTGDNYDDDERYPRRRRNDNPFDEFFSNFMNQFSGFNFDNIFDQMNVFLEDIFRQFGPRNLMGDSTDGSKPPSFVWGFRMTRGPDGRPHVERFGNVPQKIGTGAKHRSSNEREPLIDVIEDTDVLRVIAEVPGVRKEDIDLSATENSLLIQAESNRRKYYKELDLPCNVIPESASAKFKNGVLEVELKKELQYTKAGKKVSID